MPTLLEGAAPPPHLQLATTQPWPQYNPHCYPSTSSPAPMTPDSISSFVPRLHDSPLPQHDAAPLPTSGWYTTSVPAADSPHDAPYSTYNYNQSYVPSSAGPYSPHPHMTGPPDVSANSPVKVEHSAGTFSPVSNSSRTSEPQRPDYVHPPQAPSPDTTAPSHLALELASNRPRSSPTEYQWPINSLNMAGSSIPQHFYPSPNFPQGRDRSPCLSEPAMELSAPQARRFYAPIAPHPSGARTSAPKRSRDDDDEQGEQGKRRKRSDSNTSATMDLGEEDRLLIQLKDEESMPWKDIAARFQSDLGKTYQIPALQMRLKRLRERMRVWTDVDVKALRMAHEYWVQSKFDIISQKMLEYGAAEKWTARQCARKWAEIDPGPTPYTTYEHHVYTPYAMSPVEPHHFMPYVHIQ